ncbi:MAG: polysaccharide biosynthesis C-terminal domain-containing protein [Saprospiraceae bacterium]|nr:polysaccharide biosynthesis C-terminal domain-containing protein [Saprospiraceae bacterium]
MKFNSSHISQFLNDPVRQFQLSFLLKQAAVLIGSILIAQSMLSLEQIGKIEWLFYIGYIGTFFWSNGLLQSSLRSSQDETPAKRAEILWNIFRSKALLSFAWAICMLLMYPFIWDDLKIGFAIYLFFVVWMVGNVFSAFLPFLFYRMHQYKNLMLFNILYFNIYVTIFILFWVQGSVLDNLLLSLGIFGAVLIAGTTQAAYSGKGSGLNFSGITSAIRTALPLIGYSLMAGLAVVTDGWLVKIWSDDEEIFAIFRYGARELPLSLAASVALSGAVIPLISSSTESGLAQLKKRALSWMHVLFPVSIALVLSSTYLFDWFYGERFIDSVILFDVMLLLVISRLIFPQSILLAKGMYGLIFKVSVIEIMLNVGLSICLLYYFGLVGIVAGTVVAFLCEKLIMIFIIRKRFQISLSTYHALSWHLLYTMLICIALLCKYIIIYY